MSIFDKKVEKFFICENCGTLRTKTDFLNDKVDRFAYGGFVCNCEYGYIRYDGTCNSFVPVYGKYYVPYTEIPKNIYDLLKIEKNEVMRLRMYNSWKRYIEKEGE